MTKQKLIENTLLVFDKLPEDKAKEILDFAQFLLHKFEENQLINGLREIQANSQSFDFLKNEEDLYSEADLIKIF